MFSFILSLAVYLPIILSSQSISKSIDVTYTPTTTYSAGYHNYSIKLSEFSSLDWCVTEVSPCDDESLDEIYYDFQARSLVVQLATVTLRLDFCQGDREGTYCEDSDAIDNVPPEKLLDYALAGNNLELKYLDNGFVTLRDVSNHPYTNTLAWCNDYTKCNPADYVGLKTDYWIAQYGPLLVYR